MRGPGGVDGHAHDQLPRHDRCAGERLGCGQRGEELQAGAAVVRGRRGGRSGAPWLRRRALHRGLTGLHAVRQLRLLLARAMYACKMGGVRIRTLWRQECSETVTSAL